MGLIRHGYGMTDAIAFTSCSDFGAKVSGTGLPFSRAVRNSASFADILLIMLLRGVVSLKLVLRTSSRDEYPWTMLSLVGNNTGFSFSALASRIRKSKFCSGDSSMDGHRNFTQNFEDIPSCPRSGSSANARIPRLPRERMIPRPE